MYSDPSGECIECLIVGGYLLASLLIPALIPDPLDNAGYGTSYESGPPDPGRTRRSTHTASGSSASNSSAGGILNDFWNGVKDFGSGVGNGFGDGAVSTWDLLKSLGTADGWKSVGNGFLDLVKRANPHSFEGRMMNAQLAQSIEQTISDLPNMSAYEIGYGAEKLVETVALTKGAGLATNAVKSAAMVSKASSLGNAARAGSKGFTFTKTAAKHFDDIVTKGANKGQLSRPYMNSPLTIKEIMATGKGIPDATAKGALNFRVPGTFRGSQGTWELVVDPNKNLIYHFNFVK